MSKKKTLIISFMCCVVVYALFFAVLLTKNNDDSYTENSILNSLLNDSQPNFQYQTISSITPSDIQSFKCWFDGKEYIYTKTDSGWTCNNNASVTDAISVSYALNTLADIKIYEGDTISISDASQQNIKDCGLEDGFKIELTFKDGTVTLYTVGNYLKFGSAYYFTNGDGKIYTVLNRFTPSIKALCEG